MEKPRRPVEVSISFKLSKKEYVRGVRYYLRKSRRMGWIQVLVLIVALAVVAASAVILREFSFLNLMALVVLFISMGYGVFLYGWKPGGLFEKNPSLSLPVTFLFTREDIARQDEKAAVLLDWKVRQLWKGKEFYYLFGLEDGYTMFPLRAFPGKEGQKSFEKLVLDSNPGVVFRIFH